jgi:signal peptidase I
VVFVHPDRPETWLVKRVIGLPGERVTIDFGEVLIDAQPGLDRWAKGPTSPDGEWHIGEDSVFVLSDNRPATRADSRTLGPVAVTSLLRVLFHRPRT